MATEKTGSGASAPAEKSTADKAAPVEAEVAAGRTLRHDGKKYKAGDTVSLDADDAERLTALGYLKAEEEAPAAAARTDAGVSVKASDAGPTAKAKG